MMAEPTPAEWFDQFPPNPAMDGHEQWCARHWAPCPALGANGIGASTEVMQIFVNEMVPKGSHSPAAMNRRLEAAGRLIGYRDLHEELLGLHALSEAEAVRLLDALERIPGREELEALLTPPVAESEAA